MADPVHLHAVNITAIIPARMGASRLPGKPLADIGGLPMVVHTWRAAHEHPDISEAIVATDHADIVKAVKAVGGQAVITGEHPSGTDRCHAAWSTLGRKKGAVLNLQGDEPFPDPEHIAAVCHCLQQEEAQVVTARRPAKPGESEMLERVKVECDTAGMALGFSRSPSPIKGGHHIHLGLYGFAPGWLSRCASLPVGQLEQQESLEQLRWLEAGIHIQVVDVKGADGPGSVDTAEDLVRVQKWYQAR